MKPSIIWSKIHSSSPHFTLKKCWCSLQYYLLYTIYLRKKLIINRHPLFNLSLKRKGEVSHQVDIWDDGWIIFLEPGQCDWQKKERKSVSHKRRGGGTWSGTPQQTWRKKRWWERERGRVWTFGYKKRRPVLIGHGITSEKIKLSAFKAAAAYVRPSPTWVTPFNRQYAFNITRALSCPKKKNHSTLLFSLLLFICSGKANLGLMCH